MMMMVLHDILLTVPLGVGPILVFEWNQPRYLYFYLRSLLLHLLLYRLFSGWTFLDSETK